MNKKNRIDKQTISILNTVYNPKIIDDIIYIINNPIKEKLINKQNNIKYKEKSLYKFIDKHGVNTIINIKTGFIIDEHKKVNFTF